MKKKIVVKGCMYVTPYNKEPYFSEVDMARSGWIEIAPITLQGEYEIPEQFDYEKGRIDVLRKQQEGLRKKCAEDTGKIEEEIDVMERAIAERNRGIEKDTHDTEKPIMEED